MSKYVALVKIVSADSEEAKKVLMSMGSLIDVDAVLKNNLEEQAYFATKEKQIKIDI